MSLKHCKVKVGVGRKNCSHGSSVSLSADPRLTLLPGMQFFLPTPPFALQCIPAYSPFLLPVVAFYQHLLSTLFYTPRLQLLAKIRRGLNNRPCRSTTGDQMLKLWWRRCEIGRTSRLARYSCRLNIKQLATPCDSFAKPCLHPCKAL